MLLGLWSAYDWVPAAPTVTVDTHDYPFPVVDGYRKRLERQAKLRRDEEEKQRKINNIRAVLTNVIKPQKEEIVLKELEKPKAAKVIAKKQTVEVRERDLLSDVRRLEAELVFLQNQIELEDKLYREWQDEDDVNTLMYLL